MKSLVLLSIFLFSSCAPNYSPSSSGVSSSSEESSEPVKTKYGINVESEHGDVLLESNRAEEGKEITFEIATEFNYFVDKIDIIGHHFSKTIAEKADYYSFIMPDENVTISVTYHKLNKLLKPIGHRGINKGLDELGNPYWIHSPNTYNSFFEACKRNVWGMETDVHKTKDDKWVCTHDLTINSNGVSKVVSEYTLDELKAIPMDDQEGTFDADGHVYQDTICSLEDYLLLGKKYKKTCLIEFKESINTSYLSNEDILSVIDVVKNVSSLENVMFISFFLEDLLAVQQVEAKAKCQYLISGETEETASQGSINDKVNNAIKYNMDASFYQNYCSSENITKVHRANLMVNCWTINTKAGADIYISRGIDYLTTDSIYYE